MMLLSTTPSGGSSAQLCLEDPHPDRLKSAFAPGKALRVTLDATTDELRVRDGHADLSLAVHGVSVRPEGKRTISDLIEAKQKKAIR